MRKYACIPSDAAFYAFAYPAEGMEDLLEQLNLCDERWAFFLLTGGFVYFAADEETGAIIPTPIQCNAIELVPSTHMLHFLGPYRPTREALHALSAEKRLVDVTLDPLEHAGFEAWAWVLPRECPGGHEMTYDVPNKYGGSRL